MEDAGVTPLIVSYHTLSYARVADEYLLPSLRALRLAYRLEARPDFPTWEIGCGYKAAVVYDAYRTGAPILWLDSDARVYASPWQYLLGLECDVAAHVFKGAELISSAVYFAPNIPRVEWLIHKWVAECKHRPSEWDQRILQELVRHDGIRFHDLPPEYCWIDGLSEKVYGKRDPIIGQFQASRWMKANVNREGKRMALAG